SNVPDSYGVVVIDKGTGKKIGEIYLPVDDTFSLGGGAWKVDSLNGGKLYANRTSIVKGSCSFKPNHSHGAFTKYVEDIDVVP
ncbi:MAG: hypothetical protein LLG16_03805, partial [Euryarchaeota archaeon]|nr:hypothetical protein [Euryarchaeota archaeon]